MVADIRHLLGEHPQPTTPSPEKHPDEGEKVKSKGIRNAAALKAASEPNPNPLVNEGPELKSAGLSDGSKVAEAKQK